MKTKVFIIFFIFGLLGRIIAQDVIIMNNGDELVGKVLEVLPSEIKCKQVDSTGELVRIVLKSEVFMIKYENGNKEIITPKNTPNTGNNVAGANSNNQQTKNEDYFTLGRNDAMRYYVGQNSGSFWTGATACGCGPVIGLIPAAACASTPPNSKNMYMPNPVLAQNQEYYTGYAKQAHKIKKRKVWTGYGIGAAFGILIALMSLAGG